MRAAGERAAGSGGGDTAGRGRGGAGRVWGCNASGGARYWRRDDEGGCVYQRCDLAERGAADGRPALHPGDRGTAAAADADGGGVEDSARTLRLTARGRDRAGGHARGGGRGGSTAAQRSGGGAR